MWTRYATYHSKLVLPCSLVSLGKGLEKDTEFKSTYHLVCYDTVDVLIVFNHKKHSHRHFVSQPKYVIVEQDGIGQSHLMNKSSLSCLDV